MKRFIVALASLLVFVPTAFAQDFYYSDERKIPIEQSERWQVVQILQDARQTLSDALNRQFSGIRIRQALDLKRGFYWLETKQQRTLDAATINRLAQEVPIQRTIPVYFSTHDSDTTHFVMTDEFCVQFDSTVTRIEIDALNERHGVELAPFEDAIDERQARDYNEYVLRVTEESPHNALEAANLYYESPLTSWSVPNFYVNYRSVGGHAHTHNSESSRNSPAANDPLYDDQYHLHNTSSNPGTPDIDIDAPEAWNTTKGSSSITVAVVDDGVEQHEDFYSGQLVAGTTSGGGNGSPGSSADAHGQAVAGVVAANHNSTGARGVAPNVKIMPIKILGAGASTNSDDRADAIDFAWQNGADVLNNSWGSNIEGYYDDGIAAALTRARQDGRNGKGSVVVVAAGNWANHQNGNDGFVGFPATVPWVLAVGSVTKNDDPANHTAKNDSEIDLVAPSSRYVKPRGIGDVTTIDRMGSAGETSGNYRSDFGGTSAAAPQVAGVAALLLSEDPNLHEHEIREIIKSTATDGRSSDWDGAGRLNAHEAIEMLTSPPSPPSNFRIVNSSSVGDRVLLQWDPVLFADHYEIYRDDGDGNGFQSIGTTSGTQYRDFDHRISDDWSGTVVAYHARAVNSYGSSAASSYGITPVQGGYAMKKTQPNVALPDTFTLEGNTPNPVGERTTLRYALPEAADVQLTLYDVTGRAVARLTDGLHPAGFHEVQVDVANLPSGVYFYRMRAGEGFVDTGRMVVVR